MSQIQSDQPRETSQELANLLNVSLRTASDTPQAFYDELRNDIVNRPAQVLVRMTEGAVIGAAGTLALKVPGLAIAAATAGALYTGYQIYTAGKDFAGKAAEADTADERQSVAQDSANGLGETLATMVESAPGMIAGGWTISKAYGAPPLYTRIGDIVDRNVLQPVRASETFSFYGPGSMKLPASMINERGEFDALAASKLLAERHPWQGVETGSSIDLSRMRLSRIVSGTKDQLDHLPGEERSSVVTYHTHGPQSTAGDLPSNVDTRFSNGLAMLRHGDVTTFYTGQSRIYSELARMGRADDFAPSLQALSHNSQTGAAWLTEGSWSPTSGRSIDKIVSVDPASFTRTMSSIPNTSPWPAISSLAAKTAD